MDEPQVFINYAKDETFEKLNKKKRLGFNPSNSIGPFVRMHITSTKAY